MDFRSFYYTVQRDDLDTDGIGIAANALALNGGTIRSADGEDAILDLGTHAIGNDPDRKIDGSDGTEPEPTPVASFASASQSTGEGAGTRNVTVNLSPTPTSTLTLNYRVGGTATSGSDFSIVGSGTLSVLSGATTATIPVAITDDSAQESSETVILTLTSGSGYTVNSDFARHTLTIADNDAPPPPAPEPEPDCSMQIQGDGYTVCYVEGYRADAEFVRGVLNSASMRFRARYGPSSTPVEIKLYAEPGGRVRGPGHAVAVGGRLVSRFISWPGLPRRCRTHAVPCSGFPTSPTSTKSRCTRTSTRQPFSTTSPASTASPVGSTRAYSSTRASSR